MNEDPKLSDDEARRLAQHEAVKGRVVSDVARDVAHEAGAARAADPAIVEAGRALERGAVREVVASEGEVKKARAASRVAQIVDYCFFVLYGLIVIEIVLELAGARE